MIKMSWVFSCALARDARQQIQICPEITGSLPRTHSFQLCAAQSGIKWRFSCFQKAFLAFLLCLAQMKQKKVIDCY